MGFSSRSGLGCGHVYSVEGVWRLLFSGSYSLSVEQSVSQHRDARLGKTKKNGTNRERCLLQIEENSYVISLRLETGQLLCLLLGLSSQAGMTWQWTDCPLQPVCQHSSLASQPGWGFGPAPHCCGGVRLTCAASLLSQPDPAISTQA